MNDGKKRPPVSADEIGRLVEDSLLLLGDGEYITAIPKAKNLNRKTFQIRKPASSGVEEILAPIPGIITEIFIKKGEFVKSGETLLRLEAMKMENEIPARSSGKILKLNVQTGMMVRKNEILAVIETEKALL